MGNLNNNRDPLPFIAEKKHIKKINFLNIIKPNQKTIQLETAHLKNKFYAIY